MQALFQSGYTLGMSEICVEKVVCPAHFFDTNFQHAKRVTGLKKRLQGRSSRKRMVLTYQASSQVHSLFGELNPFAGNTIKVTARAELVYKSGRGPRLISAKPTAAKSD